MAIEPCINTACKSYGKPHPNCKCYGGMAEGGEVSRFCSNHRMHDENCPYRQDEISEIYKNSQKPDSAHSHIGFLAHGGFAGLHDIDHENFQSSVEKGHKSIDDHFSSLFNGKKIEAKDLTKKRKIVENWLEDGALGHALQEERYNQNDAQNFAEGGEAKSSLHNPLADNMPGPNLMLQATKANVSNYLHSLKPEKFTPKLAFDAEPDQTERKKSYENARDIAIHPLKVMHEIQKGTIKPEDLNHLKAMYPEMHDHFQKKSTEKISEMQLDGKKPPYRIQQGLSLLLGAPLSSDMLPQNVMAAQSVFKTQPMNQEQAPMTKKKKNTASLTKSNQAFLTGNQSLVGRSQKQ